MDTTILYQVKVPANAKQRVNLRQEPYSTSDVDAQLLPNCLVSVIGDGKPEGPEQFVQVMLVGYVSLKLLEKVNEG